MGQVIEGTIPTLFGGVSKQPPQVRQPNQLEVMTNALASVVTGGFEKRPPTRLQADLTFMDTTKNYKIHPIDRSASAQLFVAFEMDTQAPKLYVFDAVTGTQKTVVIGDSIHSLAINNPDCDATGTLQYNGADLVHILSWDSSETAIDWTYEASDTNTVWNLEGSADNATWNTLATGKTGTSGSFTTTLDAVTAGDHKYVRINITTGAGTSDDILTVRGVFKDMSYLNNSAVTDIKVTSVADFTFITNRNVVAAMESTALNDESGTIAGTVQVYGDLPSTPTVGDIYKIQGADTGGFGSFYVKNTVSGGKDVWEEIADPTAQNVFAESTMPHQLVRSADGSTFTFSAVTWDQRPAGNEILNPPPGFIGGVINDIGFYRNRIVLVSDETCYLSQSGDVFAMFAAKATDVLDSDPIERGATTTKVNILQYATTFRKLLFMTSAQAQFELESGDRALTPDSAIMNQATTYKASTIAKPESMGDVLFFAATTEDSAVIYEYYFQDTGFSNTALDISRHIRTYIPNDVYDMAADPASQTLFCLSTGESNSLFVYRTFFDDGNKLQSAWGKYTFGATEADAYIHGIGLFSGWIHLVIERSDGNIYLETFPIEREAITTGMPYMPLIDQRDEILGVYNSGTGLTTWTTTWSHDDDAEVVLGVDGLIPGRTLSVSYPTATTITASGDHSAGTAYVGRTYSMTCELSKIYPRQDNSPILTGRLQLQDLTVLYEKTGYFELKITPDGGRSSKSYKFEGKTLGDAETAIDSPSIATSGFFGHKKVTSRAETVKIEIINDEPEPCVITAIQWRGFFNETGRSG